MYWQSVSYLLGSRVKIIKDIDILILGTFQLHVTLNSFHWFVDNLLENFITLTKLCSVNVFCCITVCRLFEEVSLITINHVPIFVEVNLDETNLGLNYNIRSALSLYNYTIAVQCYDTINAAPIESWRHNSNVASDVNWLLRLYKIWLYFWHNARTCRHNARFIFKPFMKHILF